MISSETESQKKPVQEEISLKELFLHFHAAIVFLRRKWKVILAFVLTGMFSGLFYALLKRPKFEASIGFVIDSEGNNSSNMTAYSGLAARFGFNVDNNGSNQELFSGTHIYELMKTRRMLENTFLSEADFGGKKMHFIDRYLEISGLKDKWKNNPNYNNISFDLDSSKLSIFQNAVIQIACNKMVHENLIFPT